MISGGRTRRGNAADDRLLAALAEHIKLPLMQIARRSELARLEPETETHDHIAAIELTADTALRLLDSYLLSRKLALLDNVEIEPVSVGAVLESAAHSLSKLAEEAHTDLEIHLSGRFEPVLAHKHALEAALVSLGYVLIEAQQSLASDPTKRHSIMLGAHRGKTGIVTGLYTNMEQLSQQMLKRGHSLYGRARIAMPELSIDSGAGVFVAEALLDSMSSKLRVSRYRTLSGLATTLTATRQLELI